MNTNMEFIKQLWLENAVDDPDLQIELSSLNLTKEEYVERFGQNLAFGTGGLRGFMGVGSNRFNIYTVRLTTQAYAIYLKQHYSEASVAIAYDSRHKSDLFARESARVLAANGLKVYLAPRLMPTPLLSFAVRDLNCQGGICITASHNPAAYNGFKAYDHTGCQLDLLASAEIQRLSAELDIFKDILLAEPNDPRILEIDDTVTKRYYKAIESIRPSSEATSPLKVVYSPLNGVGREFVCHVLGANSNLDLHLIPEQILPDGDFPTCLYPNPESAEALKLGLNLAEELQADLLIATDPDSDRLGAAAPDANNYHLLNGNEVGLLLFEYLCRKYSEQGRLPEKPILITTVVSSDMVEAVAEHYGVSIIRTLTGFKFIGEQITLLKQAGQEERFIFGFEESCGYLPGSYARDKDGVSAALLFCDLTQDYLSHGLTLWQGLNSLYERYGYYQTQLLNYELPPVIDPQSVSLLDQMRCKPLRFIASQRVTEIIDYSQSELTNLPATDLLEYRLEDGSKFCLRPSGTEPKLKAYLFTHQESASASKQMLLAMQRDIDKLIENFTHHPQFSGFSRRSQSINKSYIWGDERWLISSQTDGQSMMNCGDDKSQPLGELLDEYNSLNANISSTYPTIDGNFPLLLKVIDANAPLSLQVHPDDTYAYQQHQVQGKCEFWYILACEQDAFIYLGWKEATDAILVQEAITQDKLTDLLRKIPVKPGDCFLIPPGTPHAIGAGIKLVEAQQNSNITYRLFDYNRLDKDGKRRELHLQHALAVLNYETSSFATPLQQDIISYNPLQITIMDLKTNLVSHTLDETPVWQMLYFISGNGTIIFEDNLGVTLSLPFTEDNAFLIAPNDLCHLQIEQATKLLLVQTNQP